MQLHTWQHTHLRVAVAFCALGAMLASTLGAGAATVQHAAARPVYGGTLRIAYSSDMVTFDPAQSISDDWFLVSNALYNGLYRFDRTGQPQLDLAAVPPTISADRTVWTFQIRKGVLFSNGGKN